MIGPLAGRVAIFIILADQVDIIFIILADQVDIMRQEYFPFFSWRGLPLLQTDENDTLFEAFFNYMFLLLFFGRFS